MDHLPGDFAEPVIARDSTKGKCESRAGRNSGWPLFRYLRTVR
jgi:hypothetical protein